MGQTARHLGSSDTQRRNPTTKRGILGKLAKIYDPLGLIAPLKLTAKQIYGELCETKVQRDAKINGKLLRRWKKWEEQLLHE